MPRNIEEPPPKRPPYFWWFLANVLALCFAVLSWYFCLHVFGAPENPRNYEILRKMGRLPVLTRFTVLKAPNGDLKNPKDLYRSYIPYKDDLLASLNVQLMRSYITNFSSTFPITYVEGEYVVEKVRSLGPSDFIQSGFAVRARAMVKPDDYSPSAPYPVVIDYLFPVKEKMPCPFRVGDPLSVRKSPNCAAILHVERLAEDDEPLLCLTVVPLAYDAPYRVGDAINFMIEPPAEVKPGAAFPVFKN